MIKGNSGMGMHKHGTCGCHGKSKRKSPKFLHWAKREAEKNERKAKPSVMYDSVTDAFKNFKPV